MSDPFRDLRRMTLAYRNGSPLPGEPPSGAVESLAIRTRAMSLPPARQSKPSGAEIRVRELTPEQLQERAAAAASAVAAKAAARAANPKQAHLEDIALAIIPDLRLSMIGRDGNVLRRNPPLKILCSGYSASALGRLPLGRFTDEGGGGTVWVSESFRRGEGVLAEPISHPMSILEAILLHELGHALLWHTKLRFDQEACDALAAALAETVSELLESSVEEIRGHLTGEGCIVLPDEEGDLATD